MREILFKAKRKDNNEWIEGYYVKSNFKRAKDRHYITCCQPETRSSYCGNYTMQVEIEEIIPETISQYTGLKDKNGKKIFENDEVQAFCEFKETDVSGIVKFNLYNGLELEMFDGEVWHFDYLKDIEVIKSLFDEEVK